jgi:hypothetical protein
LNGGDQVTLTLQPSTAPSLVLLKESFFPGWSARLVTPSGSSSVDLVGSEMDFMLARLESVPPGSSLVFTYGPTVFEQASWLVSLATLAGLIVWLVRPKLIGRPVELVFSGVSRRISRWGADPSG